MNKDRIPKGGRGYFDRGFLAQQEKQRQANLRRQNPIVSSPKKRAVKEIEVLNFQGIPDLGPININDYCGLPGQVRQALNPGKSVDYAVCCLMINMLEALPNGFFRPKKLYTYPEKQYATRQIRALADSLSALEVCFDQYHPSDQLKGFRNRENHHFECLGALLASPVWTGDSKYHIAYLKSPGAFTNDYDRNSLALDIVQARYGNEVAALETYLNEHRDALENLGKDLDPFVNGQLEEMGLAKESSPDLVMPAMAKIFTLYMETHPDLSESDKGFLKANVNLFEMYQNVTDELEQERLKIPDELGIINGIASRLHNSGILMVENSEVEEDIPGMAFISHQKGVSFAQRGVSLYQRRDN